MVLGIQDNPPLPQEISEHSEHSRERNWWSSYNSLSSTKIKRAFMPKPDGKVDFGVPKDIILPKGDDSSGFMTKYGKKYSSKGSSKDEKRTPLPARITWDGSFDSFELFRNQVEGHYGQVGAGYLFDEEFQKCYIKYGAGCVELFQDDVETQSQFKKDNRALYGALLSACHKGSAKTILIDHKPKQDGIRTWMCICEKYDADGNRDVRIVKLEQTIETKFTKYYLGGLLQWVQDYENAFSELVVLGEHQWSIDSSKKRRMLQNSEESGLDPTLTQKLTKSDTFAEVCNLLRGHAIMKDHKDKKNAARKVHLAQKNLDSEAIKALIHLATKDPEPSLSPPTDSDNDDIAAMINLIKQMPQEIWTQAPADVRKWIIKERLRLKAEDQGGNKPGEGEKAPTSSLDAKPGLPRQYGKANLSATEEAHEVLNAFLSRQSVAAAEEDSDDDDPLISGAYTTITTSHVGITDERAATVLNALTLDDDTYISISDNGADTCVLGKGWHVLATHPTRRAHVVGFDKEHAQKRNLPIVTGVTVVDLPDGPILLQANESIGNLSSEHTLLSEFQMREFGITVDSKAKRHGGLQRYQVPKSGGDTAEIPLCLTRALLHMKHREPSEDELATLKPIHITQGDIPWKPGRYNDDTSFEFFEDVRKLDDEDDEVMAQETQQDDGPPDNEEDEDDVFYDFETVELNISLSDCEELEESEIYYSNHFSSIQLDDYNEGIFQLEDDAWYMGEMTTHQCNNLFMEECKGYKFR